MGIPAGVCDQISMRFEVLLPHLNERQRRLLLGAEARLLGHGGVRAVAEVAGVSETTVRAGVFELEAGAAPFSEGQVRRSGGGRKSAAELDRNLVPALVEPDERGDPESPLRWTTKLLRHLAGELGREGHRASAPTVGRLLRDNGFSLQGNAKVLEGEQHPDRDAQFRYISQHKSPGGGRAGDQRGHQEAGAAGQAADGRAGVAPERRARGGGGSQLLHRPGCGASDC